MSNYGNQFYGNPTYDPYNQNVNMNGYRNYMDMNPYSRNISSPFPQNPQAPQTQQMNMQMQSANNMQFVLVPSIDVAEKAVAEKGQTIYMMNQNKPEIYAKAADGFGLQTTKYFRLFEFDPIAESQNQNNQNQSGVYVTREEFNKLISAISAEIESIRKGPVAINTEPSVAQNTKQTTNSSSTKKLAQKEAENKE